jgi:hypothetical protein
MEWTPGVAQMPGRSGGDTPTRRHCGCVPHAVVAPAAQTARADTCTRSDDADGRDVETPMMPRERTSGILLRLLPLALATALAPAARAQEAAERPAQVISINPFGLVVSYYYLEYERTVSPSASGAISGSYFDGDKYRYLSADGRFRLYPSERAPDGFAISATLGLSRVTNTERDCGGLLIQTCPTEADFKETSGTAVTTGIQLDYSWLLGAHQRFALGVGLGAKRLHYLGDRPGLAPRTQPTIRFTVGRTF